MSARPHPSRRSTPSALRALSAIAFVAALSVMLSACDWATFRHDPAHTGHNASETAVGIGNVSTLTQTWGATTGGAVVSSPAVDNGVLYVGSAAGLLHAYSADGSEHCAGSPKSCTELWTAGTGYLDSSPAVANGIVYVNAQLRKLVAFDATSSTNCSGSPKTCQPLWTATTGREIESSPAVANGVVYVGSDDGSVYAYDAAGVANCIAGDCSPLWSVGTSGPIASSPTVANGSVYFSSGNAKIYAYAVP